MPVPSCFFVTTYGTIFAWRAVQATGQHCRFGHAMPPETAEQSIYILDHFWSTLRLKTAWHWLCSWKLSWRNWTFAICRDCLKTALEEDVGQVFHVVQGVIIHHLNTDQILRRTFIITTNYWPVSNYPYRYGLVLPLSERKQVQQEGTISATWLLNLKYTCTRSVLATLACQINVTTTTTWLIWEVGSCASWQRKAVWYNPKCVAKSLAGPSSHCRLIIVKHATINDHGFVLLLFRPECRQYLSITLVLGQLISVVAIGSLWSSPFLESKSKLPCLSFANSLVMLAKTIRPSHTQPNNPITDNCCISKQKMWFTWNPIVLQWRNSLAAIVANLILPSSWLRTHLRPHAAQRTRGARNRAWCLSVGRFRVFRTKPSCKKFFYNWHMLAYSLCWNLGIY